MNGYLPETHEGLMGLLNAAAPLSTPAFIFQGGQDVFEAAPQSTKFQAQYQRNKTIESLWKK